MSDALQAESPDTVYGRLLESVHVSGYTMERACVGLEWLLEDDRWKGVGQKHVDINDFLKSVDLSQFKIAVDRRKKLAKRLEDMQATQRATARALGVTQPTVRRDLGHETSVSNVREPAPDIDGIDTNVSRPPSLSASGTEAAQTVENKLNARATQDEKRREKLEHLDTIAARHTEAPTGEYDVIVMDPPWPMQKIDREVRPNQVAMDYPTMSITELFDLSVPAADDCHLWVWTTHKFLPDAIELVSAWGFKYICTFVWHKPGGPQPHALPQFNCEFALYAHRGNPIFTETKAFFTAFSAPRGAHSEKPEEFYGVVRRVTAGRRLDMFSRREIDGFDGWGNET